MPSLALLAELATQRPGPAARGGPSRIVASAEDANDTSTTSNVAGDKVSMTFTPAANTAYLILGSALVQAAGTASVKSQMIDEASSLVSGEHTSFPANTDGWMPVGVHYLLAGNASPPTKTYHFQYRSNANGQAVHMKAATLVAVQLTASDFTARQDVTQTHTGDTSFVDVMSLTFTPVSGHDYLLIAMTEASNSSTGAQTFVQLLDASSVAHGSWEWSSPVSNAHFGWVFAETFTGLSATSKTFKLQQKTSSSGQTTSCADNRMVALDLTAMTAYYHNEAESRASTALTTYQDQGALVSATTAAADHLVIGCAAMDGSSLTQRDWGQLKHDGSAIIETNCFPDVVTAGAGHWVFRVAKDTTTATPHTWRFQEKADTSNTVGMSLATLVVMQL